jgi:hypothetical protein
MSALSSLIGSLINAIEAEPIIAKWKSQTWNLDIYGHYWNNVWWMRWFKWSCERPIPHMCWINTISLCNISGKWHELKYTVNRIPKIRHEILWGFISLIYKYATCKSHTKLYIPDELSLSCVGRISPSWDYSSQMEPFQKKQSLCWTPKFDNPCKGMETHTYPKKGIRWGTKGLEVHWISTCASHEFYSWYFPLDVELWYPLKPLWQKPIRFRCYLQNILIVPEWQTITTYLIDEKSLMDYDLWWTFVTPS